MNVLADNLKFLRDREYLSQTLLAALSGVDQALICQIETGFNTNPKLVTLTSLAGALSVTVSELIGETAIRGEQ